MSLLYKNFGGNKMANKNDETSWDFNSSQGELNVSNAEGKPKVKKKISLNPQNTNSVPSEDFSNDTSETFGRDTFDDNSSASEETYDENDYCDENNTEYYDESNGEYYEEGYDVDNSEGYVEDKTAWDTESTSPKKIPKKENKTDGVKTIKKSERKQAQRVDKEQKKIVLPKWTIFAVIGVILVIMLLYVKNTFFNTNVDTFSDKTTSILKQTAGKYRYSFDIRVYGLEDAVTTVAKNDAEELAELKASSTIEEAAEATEVEESTAVMKNNDWTNADGVVQSKANWNYPKYNIEIIGDVPQAEDNKPFTANYIINIATENYNNKFTEIVADGTDVYIDIQSMQQWLNSSGDSYLMLLSDELPKTGVKYLKIPYEEFAVPSRYAELGLYNDDATFFSNGEQYLSSVRSIEEFDKRLRNLIVYTYNYLLSDLPDSVYKGDGNVYTITATTKDTTSVPQKLVAFASSPVNTVSTYYNNLAKAGLLNEVQSKQVNRELDNMATAFAPLFIKAQTGYYNNMNVQLTGTARTSLSSTSKVQEATSSSDIIINMADKKLVIKSDLKWEGQADEVVTPQGASISRKDLSSPYLVLNVINDTIDYFNPTDVVLGEQLEKNPAYVEKEVKQVLVDFVNTMTNDNTYLNYKSVDAFIKKYLNYEATMNSTDADLLNAQVLSDYIDILQKICDNANYAEIAEEDAHYAETEQYPTIYYNDANLDIEAKCNEKESDSKLKVVDLEIKNKSTGDIELDLTKFSLHTLIPSTYAANSATQLHSYANDWDMSKSPESISITKNGYANFKIYFVTTNKDTGYMDLWYNGTKIGAVITY